MFYPFHYDDVIMTMLASQITSLPVVCSIVYSDVNQRKHQSSASLAFVREIHRGPVNFPHKWPVTRKLFPFDDVIMLRRYHETNACVWSCWLWICKMPGLNLDEFHLLLAVKNCYIKQNLAIVITLGLFILLIRFVLSVIFHAISMRRCHMLHLG